MRYEYKIVPAPERGEKRRGLKTPQDRFAAAVEDAINAMAAQGWEYQRTDALPSEERTRLTQHQTVWRHLLVFRRPVGEATDEPEAQRRERRPDPVGEHAPEDRSEPEEPASPPTMPAGPAAQPLTASRDAPPRAPRFSPPREDPEIAAPVRKLFATPPHTQPEENRDADAPDGDEDTPTRSDRD